jgi:hypothetical protein
MADYVTKIRTSEGDKQIDYQALANLPDLTQYAEDGHKHTMADITDLELNVDEVVSVPHGGTGLSALEADAFLRGNGEGTVKLTSVAALRTELGIDFITYNPETKVITIAPYADGTAKFNGAIDFTDATVVGISGGGTGGEGTVAYAVYA